MAKGNPNSNFPTNVQPKLEAGEMGEMIANIMSVQKQDKPKNVDEMRERINNMFQMCIDNDMRPGVEMLALSLGTTRQMLWKWQQEGSERGELILQAKQVIATLLEEWGTCGKLNPATLIWLQKNHFGYQDIVTLATENNTNDEKKSIEQIAMERGISLTDNDTLLDAPDVDF